MTQADYESTIEIALKVYGCICIWMAQKKITHKKTGEGIDEI